MLTLVSHGSLLSRPSVQEELGISFYQFIQKCVSMVTRTFVYQHVLSALLNENDAFNKINEKPELQNLGHSFWKPVTFLPSHLTTVSAVLTCKGWYLISLFPSSCSVPLGDEKLWWKCSFKSGHHSAWVDFNCFPSMCFWLLYVITYGLLAQQRPIIHGWHGFVPMPVRKSGFHALHPPDPQTVKNWVLWAQIKRVPCRAH